MATAITFRMNRKRKPGHNNKFNLCPVEVLSLPFLQINYVCAKAESSAIIRAQLKLAKRYRAF